MSGAAEYLADIGRAADELGYHVERIEATEIVLVPVDIADITVRIEARYLPVTGEVMRRYLRPVSKRDRT